MSTLFSSYSYMALTFFAEEQLFYNQCIKDGYLAKYMRDQYMKQFTEDRNTKYFIELNQKYDEQYALVGQMDQSEID